ncbi:immunoglobulin lambda-1 light chain-like [Acanthopagrus latus]|uniref:immunoglobulin lambda-1 light chain-like n=1 Tax=Acanthopagrus latus TaxID=8177 RepID=UPI00187C3418|nr:immunoglobulin lambda-1 light chain-like [Acanthopagrus latus]
MLFLPAAALCCLCSALVAMAAQLIQDDLTLTRRLDGDVSFSCRYDQCQYRELFWYQKKDTETFIRIMYLNRWNCNIEHRFDHPQKNDFSVVNNQNRCELKIQKVKLLHSATYYCSCYKSDPTDTGYNYLIFGSGTKLVVTDEQVVKPVVSVYPAASRAHLEGRSSLLCVASAMFPPLVRFSWKRQKKNQVKRLRAEGEQLELTESGCKATILLVDRDALNKYKYRCTVQHEGGTVEGQTEQAAVQTTSRSIITTSSAPPTSIVTQPEAAAVQTTSRSIITTSSAPPTSIVTQPEAAAGQTTNISNTTSSKLPKSIVTQRQAVSFQSQCRVKLLCVLYTVLIVKSLVYCCGLSLLRIL